jgi:hypothetical protein
VSHVGEDICEAQDDSGSVQQVQLRPYQTPRLQVYGSMKALTAGGSGGGPEGGMGMMGMGRRCMGMGMGMPFRVCRS